MDYLGFYDLKMEPFRNDPDERFYFESAGARRAFLRILRAVHQHKGLGVLMGPPGCGKTTLGDHLVRSLDPDSWAPRCLSIGHSECARGWLLPHVAQVFDIAEPADSAPALLEQIHERFVGLQGMGRHPVLIIDEAQLLQSAEVMEEFRALLNLAHEGRKTMSIVLLGLPDLADALALDAPLAQRIETRVQIDPLDGAEVAKYVEHRLGVAGGSGLFTPEAIEVLAEFSAGVPRLVNTLADNALFESFLAEARPVDAMLVAEAASELGLERGLSNGTGAAAPSRQPDWMDSLVPPPETDFESNLEVEVQPEPAEAEPPLAEEEPDLDAAPGEGPQLDPDDFSMGAIVRELEDDGEPDDDPLELDAAESEVVSEVDAEEEADEADGFAIVTSRVAEREEAVALDLPDDASDELELDLEPVEPVSEPDDAAVEDVSNFETRIAFDTDTDSSDDEVAVELDASPAELEADDGEFDPASLLDDDPEPGVEPDTSDTLDGFDPRKMLDDEIDEPAAASAAADDESDDDAEEDLDALFDEIQVPD